MSVFNFYNNKNCCEPVTSVIIKLAEYDSNNSTNMYYEQLIAFLSGFGRMFYIIRPSDTAFQHPDEVPKFYQNVRKTT